MHDVPEAAQVLAWHQAAGFNPLLVGAQRLGQLTPPQLAPRVLDHLAHIELFGPLVDLIKILGDPLEPGGQTHRLPTAGLVGRAPKQLAVHKALHQDNGMPVGLLPIPREPCQVQGHRLAGQIGILARRRQHAKPRIVGHQMQACPPLRVVPPNPDIPCLHVIGRRRPP